MSNYHPDSNFWYDTYEYKILEQRYPVGDPEEYKRQKIYEYYTTPGADPIWKPKNEIRQEDKYIIDASKFDEGYNPADDTPPLVSFKGVRGFQDCSDDNSDFDSSTNSDEDDNDNTTQSSSSLYSLRNNTSSTDLVGTHSTAPSSTETLAETSVNTSLASHESTFDSVANVVASFASAETVVANISTNAELVSNENSSHSVADSVSSFSSTESLECQPL